MHNAHTKCEEIHRNVCTRNYIDSTCWRMHKCVYIYMLRAVPTIASQVQTTYMKIAYLWCILSVHIHMYDLHACYIYMIHTR